MSMASGAHDQATTLTGRVRTRVRRHRRTALMAPARTEQKNFSAACAAPRSATTIISLARASPKRLHGAKTTAGCQMANGCIALSGWRWCRSLQLTFAGIGSGIFAVNEGGRKDRNYNRAYAVLKRSASDAFRNTNVTVAWQAVCPQHCFGVAVLAAGEQLEHPALVEADAAVAHRHRTPVRVIGSIGPVKQPIDL